MNERHCRSGCGNTLTMRPSLPITVSASPSPRVRYSEDRIASFRLCVHRASMPACRRSRPAHAPSCSSPLQSRGNRRWSLIRRSEPGSRSSCMSPSPLLLFRVCTRVAFSTALRSEVSWILDRVLRLGGEASIAVHAPPDRRPSWRSRQPTARRFHHGACEIPDFDLAGRRPWRIS